jgi:hypothetical protein
VEPRANRARPPKAQLALTILMPKLWQSSSVDFLAFRDVVVTILPPDVQAKCRRRKAVIPDWAAVTPRRH